MGLFQSGRKKPIDWDTKEKGDIVARYPRGSEWRRWDLHVHTPGTVKNDRFVGNSPDEKWEKFYSDVAAYVGDGSDPLKRIAVIGITDYLSIENYQKVKNDHRLPESVALILPDVEMRLAIPAQDVPVNIHFIFDPAFDGLIEGRFLGNLTFSYPDHGVCRATKPDLIRLGKAYDPALADVAAYKKGVELFLPSFDTIKELFDTNPDMRDRVIVIVANGSSDGVCGIGNGNGQMQGVKRNILHFANGVFSGKPSDRDYYLGKKTGCSKKAVKAECGELMPCFHGCDAHENAKLFEPDLKRYCWIKSDPTFNGLKQVLYEPEERVCISETMPEYKPDYQVIDSVSFQNPDFTSGPILLSDKLVCIIGGKSTGKSIWIYNTARTIDSEQVRKKTTDMHPPLSTSLEVDQLQVHWRGEQGGPATAHKVVYIPQTYLNRLSGDQSGEKTEIDTIIQEVLLQDGMRRASHKKAESLIAEYKVKIDKAIYDYIKIHSDIIGIKAQQVELGDKTGIEAEIKKLTAQKDRLAKEASISDEDLRNFGDAVMQIDILGKQIQSMDDEIHFIEGVASLVVNAEFSFSCSDVTRTLLEKAVQSAVQKADEVWAADKTRIIEIVKANRQLCIDGKVAFERKRDELSGMVESNKAIAQISEQIRGEERKLADFKVLEGKHEKLEARKMTLREQFLDGANYFKKARQELADEVNQASSVQNEDDLDFSVLVPFRSVAFLQAVQSVVHNNTLKAYLKILSEDNITESDYQTYLPKLIEKNHYRRN